MDRMRLLAAALAAALVITSCAPGQTAPTPAGTATPAVAAPSPTPTPTPTPEPVTLKTGQVGGVSDAAIFLAQEKGFFAEQGITLEVTFFASAAQMVTPLGTGELLVGGGASGAGLFNAMDRGVGIVIVADKGNLNPGHGYEATLVRKDLAGVIKGPKDLKGRTIAISARNITPEVTLDTLLRQGGLTIKDVKVVTIPHADMLLAFQNGAIEVGLPIEPHVARILASGVATVLTRNDAVTPNHQTAVILYSEKLVERRDVAVRFMVAYIKGARLYNDGFVKKDPQKRAEAIQLLAKATKLDVALFEQMVMPGIDPDGKVNEKSLLEIQEWFVAAGSQKKVVELSKAVDLSFAAEAVRRLGGPYR